MADGPGLASLTAAVAEALGRPGAVLVSFSGGASNAAYQVVDSAGGGDGGGGSDGSGGGDSSGGGGEPVAFVRAQVEGKTNGGPTHPLTREAELIRAAGAWGLPVPRILAEITAPGVPSALVMNVVPGTSLPSAAEVEQVGREYMTLLATLHRVSPDTFPLEPAATVTEGTARDLAGFRRWAETAGVAEKPLVALADRVLRLTTPDLDEPAVVLHGDAGPGNFMVLDGHVSALLDWELSHVGDFHEDLAWMWMRGAHTSFGDPHVRIAEYVAASGRALDPIRLQWHLVGVMWKTVVSIHAMQAGEPNGRSLLRHVLQLTYEALLCSAIGRLLGSPVRLLTETPVLETTAQATLAGWVLASAPLPRDAEIILAHLRDKAAQARWEARRLAEDARGLLGLDDPDDVAAEIAGADLARLALINRVLGGAAARAAQALPKAVRRLERARGIDLCD